MNHLPEQFPIRKAAPEKLREIAARARKTASATEFQQRKRGLGILDIAALVAAAVLSCLALASYGKPEHAKKAATVPAVPAVPAVIAEPLARPILPAPPPRIPVTAANDAAPPVEVPAVSKRRVAIAQALSWLANHQAPNGSFGFEKKEEQEKPQKGNVAATGMALLAFTRAGHSEGAGTHKDNVKRAVDWLIAQQEKNGKILCSGEFDNGYPTAIASQALVMALVSGGDRSPAQTRIAAQKAVDYCAKIHQSEIGGWHYKPGKMADTSVTGWFMSVITLAKQAKLEVPAESIEKGLKYLETTESKDKLGFAYGSGGTRSPICSAIGYTLRGMAGLPVEAMKPGIEALLNDNGGYPVWKHNLGVYYWYWATQAVLPQKGELARRWCESLDQALLPNQSQDEETGSWTTHGRPDSSLGRTGQTALAALCLVMSERHENGGTEPIELPVAKSPAPNASEPAPAASDF